MVREQTFEAKLRFHDYFCIACTLFLPLLLAMSFPSASPTSFPPSPGHLLDSFVTLDELVTYLQQQKVDAGSTTSASNICQLSWKTGIEWIKLLARSIPVPDIPSDIVVSAAHGAHALVDVHVSLPGESIPSKVETSPMPEETVLPPAKHGSPYTDIGSLWFKMKGLVASTPEEAIASRMIADACRIVTFADKFGVTCLTALKHFHSNPDLTRPEMKRLYSCVQFLWTDKPSSEDYLTWVNRMSATATVMSTAPETPTGSTDPWDQWVGLTRAFLHLQRQMQAMDTFKEKPKTNYIRGDAVPHASRASFERVLMWCMRHASTLMSGNPENRWIHAMARTAGLITPLAQALPFLWTKILPGNDSSRVQIMLMSLWAVTTLQWVWMDAMGSSGAMWVTPSTRPLEILVEIEDMYAPLPQVTPASLIEQHRFHHAMAIEIAGLAGWDTNKSTFTRKWSHCVNLEWLRVFLRFKDADYRRQHRGFYSTWVEHMTPGCTPHLADSSFSWTFYTGVIGGICGGISKSPHAPKPTVK